MQVRGGRRPASTSISANVIAAAQLISENYHLRDIYRVTMDNDSAIEWLAQRGLISNTQSCCGQPMGYISRAKLNDGRVWYCKVCKRERSIRLNSFFADSHVSLRKLVELMYWWAAIDCKQSVVMDQVGMSSEAVVNWYNYLRDIACMYCIDHPIQIGGPGVDVEIDESKFMHRKYHRGRYHEGHWVLGLIERSTNNCVMVPVNDRSERTLIPIINNHVLPGTRIITDSWRSYNAVQNHVSVNHSVSFVNPIDRTIHTNTIEGNWSNVKTKYRNMHGTSHDLFDTYLQEYMFRKAFPNNFFMNFIYWIRNYYPL